MIFLFHIYSDFFTPALRNQIVCSVLLQNAVFVAYLALLSMSSGKVCYTDIAYSCNSSGFSCFI